MSTPHEDARENAARSAHHLTRAAQDLSHAAEGGLSADRFVLHAIEELEQADRGALAQELLANMATMDRDALLALAADMRAQSERELAAFD
jgi:hypothetical protein